VRNIYVGKAVSPMELFLLKHEWGLSMGAWIYRLQDVGRIDHDTARALWREFRKNGWNKTEPGPQLARETATVWQRQVCSLATNGRISREKAAQLMGVSEEMLATMLAMG
jgi:Zn-dependent peptidase ImmA (M78 family)